MNVLQNVTFYHNTFIKCLFCFVIPRFPMATVDKHTHFAILLLLLILPLTVAITDDLIINTIHGKVQGKLLSIPGGEVRAFLGIPYGKPPIGKLRFKAPEAVEKWEGVKEATKFPNTCYQVPDTTFPGRTCAYIDKINTFRMSLCFSQLLVQSSII